MALEEAEGEAIFSGARGITQIFTDYLGLAQWFRIQARSIISKKERLYHGKHIEYLWRDVLGPYYVPRRHERRRKSSSRKIFPGDTVCIKDAQLSSFIPRSPGSFFTQGYYFWRKGWDARKYDLLRDQFSPPALGPAQTLPSDATRVAQVHFGISIEPDFVGLFLGRAGRPVWLVLWTTRTGRTSKSVQIDAKNLKVIAHFDYAKIDQSFEKSAQRDTFIVKSGARGVVRFDEHSKKVLMSVGARTRKKSYIPCEFGFPVVLSKYTYNKIRELVDQYGSVHVEAIKGTIRRIPPAFLKSGFPMLEWESGVPKLALEVDSRLLIKKPGTPDEIIGYGWAAAKYRKSTVYFYQHFKLGREDYEQTIKDSVEYLRDLLRTINRSSVFDFDEKITRFATALYGPNYFLRKIGIE